MNGVQIKKNLIAYKSLGKIIYIHSGVCRRYHRSFVYQFFSYLFYEFLLFTYTFNLKLIWNGSGDDYL